MYEIIKRRREHGSNSYQGYGESGLRQRHRERKTRLRKQLPDPQGYAKAATAAAKKILAENLKQRAHKDAKILADAQALAEKIANLPLVIAAKAEEGRIFGAITAADLAEALAAKGIEIDRKTIAVENIKTLGEYEAVAKIHRDVKATIKFTVTAEE